MNYEVLIKQSEGRAGHNGGEETQHETRNNGLCVFSWREKESREVEEQRGAESESEEVESTELGEWIEEDESGPGWRCE